MKRTHTLRTEIEARFQIEAHGEWETANPTVELTFTYSPGRPGYFNPRDGGSPPEYPEVEITDAKLIDGDGLNPTKDQLEVWVDAFLDSDKGYQQLCNAAEDDMRADADEAADRRREERRERRHDH